jgi:hypothetical protein
MVSGVFHEHHQEQRGRDFASFSRHCPGQFMRLAILRFVSALLAVISLNAEATPASGYWWNPAEPGRGFVIEIQNNQMFMAGFLYSLSGEATWVASAGTMTTSAQYAGSLVTYSGGQTLIGSFKVAAQNPIPLGTISINFSSDTAATLTWPGGAIPIQRYDFGPGGSAGTQPETNPQSGWWWNPAEGGRGFAIEVQGGYMYLAGYMYDPSGNPIWYLASGNMNSPNLFQGQWSQFANGETLKGSYKQASVINPNVGFVTLQFIDTATTVLTLPNQVQIPLNRYNFGISPPVLSAFSPASAAPAALLTLSGTGFDPTAKLSVTLSDNAGYTVTLPLAAATATNLKLPVPAYYNAATGTFGAGTLSMTLTQTSANASVESNILTGFAVQPLPVAPGTPGTSTLALIQANLSEAQKLQTSIHGTAQDTPAVNAALAQQVINLQNLVMNVQNVVLAGTSFTLGVIGGTNITVSSSNISQVDSFILATLQALANPGAGSIEKGAQQVAGQGCMGAEAAAFASAINSGANGNLNQFAQNLIEAPFGSSACDTVAAFTSAYQIFGGAGGVGIGIANRAGATGGASGIGGIALFAATASNADTAVGINALLAPALAGQTSAVQSGIGSVSALAKPVTDQLLANTSGDFTSNVGVAQNLILTVAPPPSTSGPQVVSGTYIGSAYATSPTCHGPGDSGGNSLALIATITTQGNTLSGTISGTDPGSTGIPITGSFNSTPGTWSVSIIGQTNDQPPKTIVASGSIAGNLLSGTLVVTDSNQDQSCPGYVTNAVFALVKQ